MFIQNNYVYLNMSNEKQNKMELQVQINNATTTEELKTVLENAEPIQQNGFKTSFVRHLLNTFWYFPFGNDQLKEQKRFALKLCNEYGK